MVPWSHSKFSYFSAAKSSPEMEALNLVCVVTLVDGEGRPKGVGSPRHDRNLTPLVGVTNTTPHRIFYPDRETGQSTPMGIFPFTDLSVRQEGDYRLKFTLYQLRNGEALFRTETLSNLFHVYAAKGFPGMEQSTEFTDILKKHGIRVRVSKSIRAAKKFANQVLSPPPSPQINPKSEQHGKIQSPVGYPPRGYPQRIDRMVCIMSAFSNLPQEDIEYHHQGGHSNSESSSTYHSRSPMFPPTSPGAELLPPPQHAAPSRPRDPDPQFNPFARSDARFSKSPPTFTARPLHDHRQAYSGSHGGQHQPHPPQHQGYEDYPSHRPEYGGPLAANQSNPRHPFSQPHPPPGRFPEYVRPYTNPPPPP